MSRSHRWQRQPPDATAPKTRAHSTPPITVSVLVGTIRPPGDFHTPRTGSEKEDWDEESGNSREMSPDRKLAAQFFL